MLHEIYCGAMLFSDAGTIWLLWALNHWDYSHWPQDTGTSALLLSALQGISDVLGSCLTMSEQDIIY